MAHFFSRRDRAGHPLLIAAGFGIGLVQGGLPNMTIYWVIVTATVWSTGLVLGHLSESLRRQADTDPLTGLLNRNGFLAVAARERAIADRTRGALTLAVLDLDGFKQINDVHGHAAGDRLLAHLGRKWREQLRAGDILARHGGDEFVLLLPATSSREADEVLQRLSVEGSPWAGRWESASGCPGRTSTPAWPARTAASTVSSSPSSAAPSRRKACARGLCCPRRSPLWGSPPMFPIILIG